MAKVHIRPLLRNWLLAAVQGLTEHEYEWYGAAANFRWADDADLQHLRDTYLPETIMAYISTLHFAGMCLSRDNLFECMELAAVIAGDGNVARVHRIVPFDADLEFLWLAGD